MGAQMPTSLSEAHTDPVLLSGRGHARGAYEEEKKMDLNKFTERARGFCAGCPDYCIARRSPTADAGTYSQGIAGRRPGHGRESDYPRRWQYGARQRGRGNPPLASCQRSLVMQVRFIWMGRPPRFWMKLARSLKKRATVYIPVERLLTALALVKSKAKEALDAGGVSAQKLNEAINDVRKGPYRRHGDGRRYL